MRKKTPYDLCVQMGHIVQQLMCDSWKNGEPSMEVRQKVIEKCDKVEAIYERYVNNIFELHKHDSIEETNDVWFEAYHTNKEYMNY